MLGTPKAGRNLLLPCFLYVFYKILMQQRNEVKRAEKGDFDQHLECPALKCWLRYKTQFVGWMDEWTDGRVVVKRCLVLTRKEEEKQGKSCTPRVTLIHQGFSIDDCCQIVPDAEKNSIDYQLCSADAGFGPALVSRHLKTLIDTVTIRFPSMQFPDIFKSFESECSYFK